MLIRVHLSIKQELDRIVIAIMRGGVINLRKSNQILGLFRMVIDELLMFFRSVLCTYHDIEPNFMAIGV